MRAIQRFAAGLLFMVLTAPAETATPNVLECTFKDGSNKPDNITFEEVMAWHQTRDFPKGVTEPLLFEKTRELGEPPAELGVFYKFARHDDLGIVAALDYEQERAAKFGVAQYFYYNRKTGAAQLIAVTDPAVPAEIEIGTCSGYPK
jgi:hypothetical protein